MGVFCPVVQALVRAMFNSGHDFPFRCTVGPELVGDHHARQPALSFQELSHQTPYSLGIAAVLDQDVKG